MFAAAVFALPMGQIAKRRERQTALLDREGGGGDDFGGMAAMAEEVVMGDELTFRGQVYKSYTVGRRLRSSVDSYQRRRRDVARGPLLIHREYVRRREEGRRLDSSVDSHQRRRRDVDWTPLLIHIFLSEERRDVVKGPL